MSVGIEGKLYHRSKGEVSYLKEDETLSKIFWFVVSYDIDFFDQ